MSTRNTGITADRRRQALRSHSEQLAEHVAVADHDTSVPTCPGWTVANLVAHVGQTQRWVTNIIEGRIVDPTLLPAQLATMPTAPGDWPAWLSDGGARAAEACSDEALVAPVFNPASDHRSGGEFWLSSLLNEAVIHGVDTAYAAGRTQHIEADVAAHLITHHLAMLTSPTWAALRPDSADALRGTGETLHLHATDKIDLGDWFIERGHDSATWQARSGEADVTLTGPAAALLLILTRRRQLTEETDHVSVHGDLDLAEHWIQNTAHQSG